MVLAKSTVVGIQETHGTVEKMRLELAQYRPQWRIFVSASANPNSGGVILFSGRVLSHQMHDSSSKQSSQAAF